MIQRVLVRHGIGRDKIALLLDDLQRSVDLLTSHRPAGDLERTAFHH